MGEAVCHSFNRAAKSYARYCRVQDQIISQLLSHLAGHSYARVLDLGCGSGNVIKQFPRFNLSANEFIGVDFSLEMLTEHPQNIEGVQKISLIYADFEDMFLNPCDLVIASSSLQWAKQLEFLCTRLCLQSTNIALAVHTNRSLHALHAFLGSNSPLRSQEQTEAILNRSLDKFKRKMWTQNFTQHFKNRQELLQQLKFGGLLGGGMLSYAQKKALKQIPLQTLDYEVVFCIGQR
ncbi:methyltransferase domain-containing protein [Helicobacter suis]|uniref:methyltransferase domain-containing protein n=1 Tax=Helicobacter suis TaxID=104628 RepID=UPI001599B879|nr:methyltransferase domain-containing protein [Helicobacter suis]BCD49236.1 Biotin synthase BioC [Helicobacter suis]